MVDTGAKYSVIGAHKLMEEQGTPKRLPPLCKWQGKRLSTLHDVFLALGEWTDRAQLDSHPIGARYCVVQERVDLPILGLDWQKHYQACRDWKTDELEWTDPVTGEVHRAAIIDTLVSELRLP